MSQRLVYETHRRARPQIRKEGRTVAKSFRLSEKALETLEEEADRRNVSVNTLVNQLLLDFSEFGRFSQRMGDLRLSKKTFSEILNSVPDHSIVKIAEKTGKSGPTTIIASKYGEVTLESVIEFIHDLSAYANLFEYYERNENDRWTITLMHELGPKWSTFLVHYIGVAFKETTVQVQTRVSEGAVVFSLDSTPSRTSDLSVRENLR